MNVDIHRQEDSRAKHFVKLINTQKIDEVKKIKSPTFIQPGNDFHATKIDYIMVSNNMLGSDRAIYTLLPKVSYNASPHQALMLKLLAKVV